MTPPNHPLEAFGYCPRCGSSDFGRSDSKSLYCAACGLRYYINMSAATAVVIYDALGRVLFTRRKYDPAKGKLDLPGGFIDLGETAEEAIQREVQEELGIPLKNLTFLGTFPNQYEYSHVLYQTLDIVFVAEAEGLELLKAADDVESVEFRKATEVKPEEIGLESIRRVVEMLRGQK